MATTVTHVSLYCQPGKWQKAFDILKAIKLRYPKGIQLTLVDSGAVITSQFTALTVAVDNLDEVVKEAAAAAKPEMVNLTTTEAGTFMSVPLVLGFNILLITKP